MVVGTLYYSRSMLELVAFIAGKVTEKSFRSKGEQMTFKELKALMLKWHKKHKKKTKKLSSKIAAKLEQLTGAAQKEWQELAHILICMS